LSLPSVGDAACRREVLFENTSLRKRQIKATVNDYVTVGAIPLDAFGPLIPRPDIATVPMVFMPLIGVNDITVSVTAQTKKTTGLEVAVVLDNTGSMLCGPNDGHPIIPMGLAATVWWQATQHARIPATRAVSAR
jgi:hypothetical protein